LTALLLESETRRESPESATAVGPLRPEERIVVFVWERVLYVVTLCTLHSGIMKMHEGVVGDTLGVGETDGVCVIEGDTDAEGLAEGKKYPTREGSAAQPATPAVAAVTARMLRIATPVEILLDESAFVAAVLLTGASATVGAAAPADAILPRGIVGVENV
jgi:hypothetical protein